MSFEQTILVPTMLARGEATGAALAIPKCLEMDEGMQCGRFGPFSFLAGVFVDYKTTGMVAVAALTAEGEVPFP
jgi:hypothetical protein